MDNTTSTRKLSDTLLVGRHFTTIHYKNVGLARDVDPFNWQIVGSTWSKQMFLRRSAKDWATGVYN